MGKMIVIEGLDGSGKGTQTKRLLSELVEQGVSTLQVSFPNYASPSASLVKMYLSGAFGKDPADVNAYAASTFYAVDRFANYETQWKQAYREDTLILCDRYTTSNIVYQLGKLPKNEWEDYVCWLEEFEYHKLALPRPDLVLYLDMPVEVSQKLIAFRYGGDESKKDIHEKDIAFLKTCRENALYAAHRQGWQVVNCAKGNSPRTVEDIHKELLAAAMKIAFK